MESQILNNQKPVRVVAVAVITIVTAVLSGLYFFFSKPQQQFTELKITPGTVPQELILGEPIQSNVRLEYSDPTKVGFSQYRTSQAPEQIIQYYTDIFANSGWVVEPIQQVNNVIILRAHNPQNNIRTEVAIFPNGGLSGQILVAVTVRPK